MILQKTYCDICGEEIKDLKDTHPNAKTYGSMVLSLYRENVSENNHICKICNDSIQEYIEENLK